MVASGVTPASKGGVEQSVRQAGANKGHEGDPASDTGDFPDNGPGNLRVDYVLPSKTLTVVDTGVFWPPATDPHFKLVNASDHRLVWLDVRLKK